MPSTGLFCDSWDHYTDITEKWDDAGTDVSIRLNTGASRTGIGCLQINSGARGPRKNLAHFTYLITGTAYYSSLARGEPITFAQTDTFLGIYNVRIAVNVDGSISALRGNDPTFVTLGSSAPGVYQFNTYNYIDAD